MTTSFDSLANLSEQELLEHFTRVVARDCRTTAELLVAIAEIDERKIWAAHACSSMFTFCIERFHMSEQVTAKRIWAARTARRFPVILEMVARGDLHLGAILLLAKHLTAENHVRVLERARHMSSRDVEALVAELAPQPDVPSRIRALPRVRTETGSESPPTELEDTASHERGSMSNCVAGIHDAARVVDAPVAAAVDARIPSMPVSRAAPKPVVPLSPRRYKIEITVDEATHDRLRSLQDLLARTETGRDPAAIVSRAIEVLLARTLARKAACADRPKPEKAMPAADALPADRTPRSRTIPAAVRREVWLRDSGRCCYVDGRGHRCAEASNVEFHHKTPFALGGLSTTENIELRCVAHNQFQADLEFGRTFMDARRRKVAEA